MGTETWWQNVTSTDVNDTTRILLKTWFLVPRFRPALFSFVRQCEVIFFPFKQLLVGSLELVKAVGCVEFQSECRR